MELASAIAISAVTVPAGCAAVTALLRLPKHKPLNGIQQFVNKDVCNQIHINQTRQLDQLIVGQKQINDNQLALSNELRVLAERVAKTEVAQTLT